MTFRTGCPVRSSVSAQTSEGSGVDAGIGGLLPVRAAGDGLEGAAGASGQTPQHRGGDAVGLHPGVLGDRAAEPPVEGLVPQLQPSIEVLGRERMAGVENEVELEGVAVIAVGAEQHGLPEVAHDRQMAFQIQHRDLGEDRPQQRVSERRPVEPGHELSDVRAIREIPHVVRPAISLVGRWPCSAPRPK
jgi:hypothetical protein